MQVDHDKVEITINIHPSAYKGVPTEGKLQGIHSQMRCMNQHHSAKLSKEHKMKISIKQHENKRAKGNTPVGIRTVSTELICQWQFQRG